MGDNATIIDGRDRFRQRAASARSANPFEERLAETARVPIGDRPRLAANLGRLAERVSPSNGLLGAKRMIEETGHDGLWQKRKRFIRLPNEASEPDIYGATGSTYLQLARAAGKLLARGDSLEAIERERERAVRTLVSGTSYLPNYAPLSKSDRTAKALLDEYASALLEAVKSRTRLLDLWSVLRECPIDLEARSADEEPFETIYGEAEDFPTPLLRPIFRDHIIEAVFRPKDGFGFGWEEPTVELGFMSFQVATSVFMVPEEVGRWFHFSSEDDDGGLCKEGRDWLNSIGAKSGEALPSVEFDDGLGYGWKPASLSMLRNVGLSIVQGEENAPRLQVNLWGGGWDEGVVAYGPHGNSHHEQVIVESDGKASQLRYVDAYFGYCENLNTLYSSPVTDEAIGEANVIGLLPESWAYPCSYHGVSAVDLADETESAALFLSSQHRFIPTIPACEPVAGPVRRGSLGAGLLNNALAARPVDKVTNLMIERAALTADAGLRFHETLIDFYREALRRI